MTEDYNGIYINPLSETRYLITGPVQEIEENDKVISVYCLSKNIVDEQILVYLNKEKECFEGEGINIPFFWLVDEIFPKKTSIKLVNPKEKNILYLLTPADLNSDIPEIENVFSLKVIKNQKVTDRTFLWWSESKNSFIDDNYSLPISWKI
jgi:hypothetical protein